MKIRVITNGITFRVERWRWWMPWWVADSGGDYGEQTYEWPTQEQAQAYVDRELERRRIKSLPWKVVAIKKTTT